MNECRVVEVSQARSSGFGCVLEAGAFPFLRKGEGS